MLATGKGWVLAMLAMLGPKPGLRVAARGSGPGAKRRRPCPPLRAGAAWKASGRRASRRIDAKRACRPGVEQRADEGSRSGGGAASADPGRNMARKRARSAVQSLQQLFRIDLAAKRQTALSRVQNGSES